MSKVTLPLFLLILPFILLAQEKTLTAKGLQAPVEIIVDQWGIPHIYAQNEKDLFFAQGYYAASDRLFQLEVWRRQATGTVAELLGPRELKRDIGTRLFKFRGDITAEMQHYHPRGEQIIRSFVEGVNAYIEWALAHPADLPMEFKLLQTKPEKWTPEVVISRHQGLLGNITAELNIGRQVALLGVEKTKSINWFHPNDPALELDDSIDPDLLFADILGLYNAYRRPVQFLPEDIVAGAQINPDDYRNLVHTAPDPLSSSLEDPFGIGSNNWVVNGQHTQSGYPMMANDPHRTQAVPSLRYMAHLVAPGWNVIGGGEPEIPGISIGHNEYGAWGLTVFRTDAEDLYVYETNPANPNQYRYKGAWEVMHIIKERIPVKGQQPVEAELKYTRHGPVVYEDAQNHKAYAVRCGWLEIGGSPYLASLRMNQSENFEAFREACNYSHIPGENMVWADRKGNIGWQAVGIAPVRRHFSGLVPVPGDGRFEWDGYLPIKAKPNLYNPPDGIFSTANQNVTPPDFDYPEALGYSWSDPYRGARVEEVLRSGRKHNLQDMAALQTDYLSIPARTLVPLLKELPTNSKQLTEAVRHLLNWDFVLDKTSVAAAIYVSWERQLRQNMTVLVVPEKARPYVGTIQLKKVIDWLLLPDGKFGQNSIAGRDAFLLDNLQKAVDALTLRLGPDWTKWQYGQEKFKHITLKHPLSNAVKEDIRQKLEVGPAPRGGNGYTPGSTGGADNQPSGGSFRLIVDTADWDHSLGSNTPGQSGNPEDPHYRNLFDLWAKDKYFPVFYSRKKVESVKEEVLWLQPE